MSTWDRDSELSRANRAPVDSAFSLSPLAGDCLALALELRAASGGAFEPGAGPLMRLWGFTRREGRLPDPDSLAALLPALGAYSYEPPARRLTRRHPAVALDLGGIAKGYALDLAAADLRALGLRAALIDLGGNLYCLGEAAPGEAWQVGIRDPLDRERMFAALALRDEAVATSGSYERFVDDRGPPLRAHHESRHGPARRGSAQRHRGLRRSGARRRALHGALRPRPRRGRGPAARPPTPRRWRCWCRRRTGIACCVRASAGLRGRLRILPADAARCRIEFF